MRVETIVRRWNCGASFGCSILGYIYYWDLCYWLPGLHLLANFPNAFYLRELEEGSNTR